MPQKQVTNEDRKKQAAQLLELGIGVPDEFRGELAIPGEWRVTSTRVISEEGEDVKPKRPEAMGIGVRKRAVEEDEEEKIEEKRRKRSMFKSYPGDEEDRDLDALLSQVAKPKIKDEDEDGEVKKEPEPAAEEPIAAKETVDGVEIKPDPEPSAEAKAGPALSNMPTAADAPVKQEDGQPTGGIVFKKRKAKNIRQK